MRIEIKQERDDDDVFSTAFAILMFAASVLYAQTPSFEVASIKSNKSGPGPSSSRIAPGQVTMENVSLKKCIAIAYGIRDDRDYAISGPGWLRTESFDILAKFPPETSPENIRLMLQSMLAERFKLATHQEIRQLNTYSLVSAKNGLKIKPVDKGSGHTSAVPGRLDAEGITIAKLSDLLSRFLDRPVVDSTRNPGIFSFTLEWRAEDTRRVLDPDDTVDPIAGPSIFTALEEQLGLKMIVRKGPVEILVVDHAEKLPTEN